MIKLKIVLIIMILGGSLFSFVSCKGDGDENGDGDDNRAFFSVGGTVSQLAGSGLSLQNNGGAALAISGNGVFTFPLRLPNGASYKVTLASPPTAPNQICTITGGAGTITGNHISDILVVCAILPPVKLSLTSFAFGLNQPVGVYHAGPGDDRLFVIEKAGKIRIVQKDGAVLLTPFLDISSRVLSGGEQGLLGLAFHPNYAVNGFFYVNYTHNSGTRLTRISRFQVTGNPNLVDAGSENILLTVNQPDFNHNAGDIHFGPDGFLYIPLGDGGGGGDTNNNAQNMGLLLGKVIRIDIDSGPTGGFSDCAGLGTGQYTIPPNPFIDGPGNNCDEIWALGLRNPWRSSFDRLTGDYFIADVGQSGFEEIDFQSRASTGGENYGWRCYEGDADFNLPGCGTKSQFTFPIITYLRSGGHCSVIGGYVYRGIRFPALSGRYLFTDFCSGSFWDTISDGAGAWITTEHLNLQRTGFVSFGEDSNGEIYVVHQGGGELFLLEGK